jgi:autotransporter-associated beta strand protein
MINGGTLGLGAGASLSSASGISGSGIVAQASGGLATLSGSSNYTGGTFVTSGTLQGLWSSGGTWATFGAGSITNNATLVLTRAGGGDPFFTQAITGTGATILQSTVGGYINLAAGAQFSASSDLSLLSTGLNIGQLSQTVGALTGNSSATIISNFGAGNVTLSVGNNNDSGVYTGSIIAGQGTIALVKNGTGTEVLGSLTSATISGSSFTGDITVNGGTLIGAAASNGNNGPFGAGSNSRNINVNAGATLVFDAPNMFAQSFFGATNVPTLNINGGVVTNGDPAGTNKVNNALNNVNLTGGTLAATTGQHPNGYAAGYAAWNINGTVTSSGNSVISTTDPVYGTTMLSNGAAANGVTTFNVQNGTLLVSAPLVEDLTDGLVGGLRQTGAGTLLLTAPNTYSGNSTVNGGTLQLGDGAANNGSVVGNIVNNSTVVFANPAAQLFRGNVSGNGNLVKTGPGTLTVAAQQTYTGPTTVSAGTVKLSPNAFIAGFGNDTTGVGSNSTWTINSTTITSPAITNGVLTLTDGNNSEARSAFYNTPMPTTAPFTVSFNYQMRRGSTGAITADGMAFVLQDDPRGASALGGAGGQLGYGDGGSGNQITPSVGTGFNIYYFVSSPNGLSFGVSASNGSLVNSGTTGPVNVESQDPIRVVLSYDGSNMFTESLTDLGNNATYTTSYAVGNLATSLGNTAYLGFTGATGGDNATQTISNFSTSLQYSASNMLPAGTALTLASGGMLDLNAGSQQVDSLSGSGAITNSGGALAKLTIGGPDAGTFGGSIRDGASQVALAVTGGALTLTGSNTFTGGTTVNNGELTVTNAYGLADGSNLSVGDPSLLTLLPAAVVPAPVVASAAVTPVPEPGTLGMLAAGAVAAAFGARRWRLNRRLTRE